MDQAGQRAETPILRRSLPATSFPCCHRDGQTAGCLWSFPCCSPTRSVVVGHGTRAFMDVTSWYRALSRSTPAPNCSAISADRFPVFVYTRCLSRTSRRTVGDLSCRLTDLTPWRSMVSAYPSVQFGNHRATSSHAASDQHARSG